MSSFLNKSLAVGETICNFLCYKPPIHLVSLCQLTVVNNHIQFISAGGPLSFIMNEVTLNEMFLITLSIGRLKQESKQSL